MDHSNLRRLIGALASVLSLSFVNPAAAEPPLRAARLGFIDGTVSFSPAGQRNWVHAPVNRPLTTGDRLWTGSGSRAEVQIGSAAIRMGPSTSMVLLNFDDRIAQVQLSQGTLRIRVRSLGPRQVFEVATPNLAFTVRRPGDYRIEVDPNDDATAVVVRSGEAEVYGEGASYTVNSRRAHRFYGTDLSDYEIVTARVDDDLDRWSRERDRRADRSVSARYVSTEVVGYEDLDAHGNWRVDPTHGNVWIPRRVASDWTPYRDGHWSWVDPWGWTWVDDAPWGYAVSHYGRWAHIGGTWAWVPGPRRERAVYAPALVAFVGDKNFQVSLTVGGASTAAVGWFPLAPREVYRPSYPVSRGYFDNINRSNAVIAPTTITNVYNTTIVNNTTVVNNTAQVIYANQQVTGAVIAVPTQTFVQSQAVSKATVHLSREAVVRAPVVRAASVAPVQQSVQGNAREADARPPARERVVVARTAPPQAAVPFAAQQAQLAAKPGTPIDEANRAQLKQAAPAASAPAVRVVATAPAPTPTALPPATPPAAKSPQARRAAAAKSDAAREGRKAEGDKTPGGATAAATPAEASRDASAKAATADAEAAKAAAARADAAKTADAKAADAKAADVKAADAKAADAKAADIKAAEAKAAEAKAAETKAAETRASNAKAEAAKADDKNASKARADAAKADALKAEAARAEATKADAARAAAAKAATAQTAATQAAATQAAAAKAATERAEASKAAAARAAEAKADATRDSKAEAAKAGAMKAEAARAEAVREDASKVAAAKAEAARAEAAKADAGKAAAAKAAESAEASRVAAAKAAEAKADAAKAAKDEAAKAEAARGDAAKAAAAKADAAKAEAVKAQAAKTEAAKADAARADAARAATQAQAAAAKADATAVAARADRAAAGARAEATPPRSRASGPKSDVDANPEGENTKETKDRRKP